MGSIGASSEEGRLTGRELGEVRMPSRLSRSPSELELAFAEELRARHLAASEHRTLLRTASAASRTILFEKRRTHVKALREEYDEQTGKDLAFKLRSIQPAKDEDLLRFAVELNVAMCRVWPESRSQSTYFRLYRLMDRDNSGLITYYELVKMCRDILKFTPQQMSEPKLLALWRSVDKDVSGTISAGEFLRVVRRGWPAFVQEQSRLSKTQDLLRRPNWNPANFIPHDKPAWNEQTMTLAEKHRFYIEAAQDEMTKRKERFERVARKYGRERQRWEQDLENTMLMSMSRSPSVPMLSKPVA